MDIYNYNAPNWSRFIFLIGICHLSLPLLYLTWFIILLAYTCILNNPSPAFGLKWTIFVKYFASYITYPNFSFVLI